MVRFGEVHVDLEARQVVRGGEVRHLEPRAFDVLEYLIAQRARVVPKTELLDEVWGSRFVSESALTTRIKEIRQALGDDGTRQAMIRNVRSKGYRFVAEPDASPGAGHRRPRRVVPVDLVGRAADIEQVSRLLGPGSVVTLVGPGGVGKTALAGAVADCAGRDLADGVVFVDLSTVAADGVLPAVRHAAAIADPAEGGDLAAAIAGLDAVVVVDNCEHVLAAAAGLVEEIRGCRGPVRILATSRERLGVAGERVHPVHPLEPADAEDLLVRRAVAADPAFRIGDGDRPRVEQLLEALDRLPLAIEMAAARSASINLADLVDLIAERLDLLRAPSPTVEDRHRSLTAVVAWSEELLEPGDRRVLIDCSVFAGPVAGPDIAGVLRSGQELDRVALTDAVARLAERSLVDADVTASPTTYRLFETVKAHVAPRRHPDVARSHARWFCDVAAEADLGLRAPGEPAAHRRLEAVTAEIRSAHRWARRHDPALAASLSVSLALYGYSRMWSEPAAWARALLAVLPDGDPAGAAACVVLAGAAAHAGELERAEAWAARAASGADPRADRARLEILSDVSVYRGAFGAVERYAAELRRRSEQVGDLHGWAIALVNHAVALSYSGDTRRAARLLDEVADLGGLAPSSRAWHAYGRGEITSGDDPASAVQAFEEAIALGRSVGNRFVTAVAEMSQTAMLARSEDAGAALSAFASNLRECRRRGNLAHGATLLRNLVGLLVRLGEDELAATLVGALSAPGVKGTYGEEAARLEAAGQLIEARNGSARTGRWRSQGRREGLRWALDRTLETLGDR